MEQQQHNQTVRLLAVLFLPMLLLAACDSLDSSGDETVSQMASVNFDATASWPSYGERIRGVGQQMFQYRAARTAGGAFDIDFRPEAIEAAFTGMASGDSYEQSWLGPSDEWENVKGPAGTERYISETILLTNSRTAEVAEGLVVTRAVIMGSGGLSFEVSDIIPLP